MKSRLLRRAAGVMCAAPAMAAAQQPPSAPPPITHLDAVTVTASRVPLDAVDQPVQVSVLTAEQIRTSSAVTVQELLSTHAGIHVVNSTGAAEQAAVDIRGFGLA